MGATTSQTHRGMGWPAETQLGRWTISLAGLALGGTAVRAIAFSLGLEPADSFTDNWLLTGAGAAILASGAASVVTGALAFLRRHDRSWMVLSATGLGVLVTALSLQQVAEGLGWLAA